METEALLPPSPLPFAAWIRALRCLALGVLPLVSLPTAMAAPIPYTAGWTWNRQADWTPGTTPGSSAGNADDDQAGNPVWQYEWTTGGALGSTDPWYANPGTLMVWDENWFGSGRSLWATADDTNPPISQPQLTHTYDSDVNWSRIPLVRWRNPTGALTLDITGTLTEVWSGQQHIGEPVDVDVVLAFFDASAGTTSVILAQTLSKPTPSATPDESIVIRVEIRGFRVDTGDQLILTHRARNVVVDRWNPLVDDLTITVVPEPVGLSVSLLGVLGVAFVGWRRRR